MKHVNITLHTVLTAADLLDEHSRLVRSLHQRAGPGRQVALGLHTEHVRLHARPSTGASTEREHLTAAQRRQLLARVHQPAEVKETISV